MSQDAIKDGETEWKSDGLSVNGKDELRDSRALNT